MSVSDQQRETFFWVTPELQGAALFLQHVTHFKATFWPLFDLRYLTIKNVWIWLSISAESIIQTERQHPHKLHPASTAAVIEPEHKVDFCNLLVLSMLQNFPEKRQERGFSIVWKNLSELSRGVGVGGKWASLLHGCESSAGEIIPSNTRHQCRLTTGLPMCCVCLCVFNNRPGWRRRVVQP